MSHGPGRIVICLSVVAVLSPAAAVAQGRGAQIWTTASGDAARTASVRNDARISRDTLSRPGFQLLWKRPLETRAALSQPVFSAPGFITYKGFKGLAYVAGASDTVYAIDYDLNRMFWTKRMNDGAVAAPAAGCADRLPAITETATLPQSANAARDAGPGPARGGGGRAGGAVAAVYAVSSAGMLHSLNLQDGSDWFPPAKLLPSANGKIVGSILANGVMYVATADNCGGVPNGVYAMDLTPMPAAAPAGRGGLPTAPVATPASTNVVRWETHGGGIVGTGPALGPDGTVYVATGDGASSENAFSDSIVALEPKTLAQKAYFTPGKTPFTTSPIVFALGDKDIVAAANADGKIYFLDAASIGGADHKTALGSSDIASPSVQRVTGLATVEANGATWLVTAATWAGSPQTPKDFLAAARVSLQNGAVAVEPVWIAPQDAPQLTPTIVNGVVFGISAAKPAAGGAPARSPQLYALDLASGNGLWNSGDAITSPVRDIGPAVDDGQVYVAGTDGTLYTFGFVVER
jgi:hypothetical protein